MFDVCAAERIGQRPNVRFVSGVVADARECRERGVLTAHVACLQAQAAVHRF
jgi:hypothetical protein